MTLSSSKRRPDARSFRSRITWAAALFAVFVLGVLVTLVGGAAAATAVPLGTADSFAVTLDTDTITRPCATPTPTTATTPTATTPKYGP